MMNFMDNHAQATIQHHVSRLPLHLNLLHCVVMSSESLDDHDLQVASLSAPALQLDPPDTL